MVEGERVGEWGMEGVICSEQNGTKRTEGDKEKKNRENLSLEVWRVAFVYTEPETAGEYAGKIREE